MGRSTLQISRVCDLLLEIQIPGAEEVVQLLRALTDLGDDLGLVPST